MRIIAGYHRGHCVHVPGGMAIRPTAERARESVFDILEHSGLGQDGASPVRGACVLDAFCGVGSLGLESLSRGASKAILLDKDKKALACARANARSMGEETRCHFLLTDVLHPPEARDQANLFFLDPPYGKALLQGALPALREAGWLAGGAIGVVELGAREEFIPPAGFIAWREKRAGAGRFFFLTYQG